MQWVQCSKPPVQKMITLIIMLKKCQLSTLVPGDTLVMEVEIKKWNKRFGIATAVGRAYVDGEMAVELDEM